MYDHPAKEIGGFGQWEVNKEPERALGGEAAPDTDRA